MGILAVVWVRTSLRCRRDETPVVEETGSARYAVRTRAKVESESVSMVAEMLRCGAVQCGVTAEVVGGRHLESEFIGQLKTRSARR